MLRILEYRGEGSWGVGGWEEGMGLKSIFNPCVSWQLAPCSDPCNPRSSHLKAQACGCLALDGTEQSPRVAWTGNNLIDFVSSFFLKGGRVQNWSHWIRGEIPCKTAVVSRPELRRRQDSSQKLYLGYFLKKHVKENKFHAEQAWALFYGSQGLSPKWNFIYEFSCTLLCFPSQQSATLMPIAGLCAPSPRDLHCTVTPPCACPVR